MKHRAQVVGALAAPLAAHPLFTQDDVRKAELAAWVDGVHQPVRGSVAGVLSGALHMTVRSAVSAAITEPVHQAVMDGVHKVVRRGLIEGIHAPVHHAVNDAVGAAAAGRLAGRVRAAALDAVGEASGEVPRRALDPLFVPTDESVRAWTRQAESTLVTQAMYGRWCWSLGGWGLHWPAYCSFLRQVCGLELPGDLWLARPPWPGPRPPRAGGGRMSGSSSCASARPSCTWSGPAPATSPGSTTPTARRSGGVTDGRCMPLHGTRVPAASRTAGVELGT